MRGRRVVEDEEAHILPLPPPHPLIFSEPPQETDGQEEYEEEGFEFSERENRANNNNTPDIAKLSQMEYYSTYGKGAGRFSTA